MFENLSLFPETASRIASEVDALTFFLAAVSLFFVVLIAGCLVILSLRFRRTRAQQSEQIEGSLALEALWTVIPLIIVLCSFGWGAKLYYEMRTPPKEGMQFYVTGKQWMWKVQHPTGQREINSLHVPVGETILLTMTSEDVIHDFFIPAFRVKADTVPGMYTSMWFEATKKGTYHLFCAEYCGTSHSEMIGEVVVMDPADYQEWLNGQPAGKNPIESGKILFENLRCDTCHAAGSGQRGPDLAGRFGLPARLSDGQTVLFDEDYVRESILEPNKKLSAGFQPLMPTYQGQVSEDQLLHLIAYIKSMTDSEADSE